MSADDHIDYTAKAVEGTAIRTLSLLPGKASDPIRCVLNVVDLEDEPTYEALSYTWGDAGVTEVIEVDGVAIPVTVNLEVALRHFRDTDNSVTLWVDAVCINQRDNEEKNVQVAMMGRIYKQCTQVRIWLGCDANNCGLGHHVRRVDSGIGEDMAPQDPFQVIRRLASMEHIEWPKFGSDHNKMDLEYRDNQALQNALESFFAIIDSKWWTRVWTIQEAILPPAGTMTYDIWTIQLDEMMSCCEKYFDHVWDCCSAASMYLPKDTEHRLDEIFRILYTLSNDRKTAAEGEWYDLHEQHISYGRRQCQNPRDKVYGLLALIGDVSDYDIWLSPQYDDPVKMVYRDATYAMLYSDTDLKCLTGAGFGPSEDKLASWVYDFGASFTQLYADVASNRLIVYDLYDAATGTKSRPEQLTICPGTAQLEPYEEGLEVVGRFVGKVASVYSIMAEDAIDDPEVWRTAFRGWLQEFRRCQPDSRSEDGILEHFLRTISSDAMSIGTSDADNFSDWRRYSRDESTLENFTCWLETGSPEPGFALGRTLTISTNARCLYRTEDNRYGLCYPTVKSGDEIWVINGCKVPMVLRTAHLRDGITRELRPMDAYGPDEDGLWDLKEGYEPAHTHAGYYELIGDCYLEGYMDGEAVSDLTMEAKYLVLV